MKDLGCVSLDVDEAAMDMNEEQRSFLTSHDIDEKFFDDCLKEVIPLRIKVTPSHFRCLN
jgi:hypothetical protein